MTVKELIKYLKKFDSNLFVAVQSTGHNMLPLCSLSIVNPLNTEELLEFRSNNDKEVFYCEDGYGEILLLGKS